MQKPDFFEGTLSSGTDFIPSNGMRASQIAVENRDISNSFTMKVNESDGFWTFDPGEKLGLRFKNEVSVVHLEPVSGPVEYQLMLK